jgi:ABC-type multidrug transport system fused ATPase/permease subunit
MCPTDLQQWQQPSRYLGIIELSSTAAAAVAAAAAARYGSVLVLEGRMSLGDLNAYMLYAIFVSGSAGGIAGTAASLIAAVSANYACVCKRDPLV